MTEASWDWASACALPTKATVAAPVIQAAVAARTTRERTVIVDMK
jgi:hypothetical protein